MNQIIETVASGVLPLIGFTVGFLLAKHAKAHRVDERMCGCGHHQAFHDAESCRYVISYYTGDATTCTCYGYVPK